MSDQLATIVLGLQRVGENAQQRSIDLEHIQAQERRDLAWWLTQQLKITEEVAETLRAQLLKLGFPAPQAAPAPRQQLPSNLQDMGNSIKPKSVAMK